MTPNPRTQPIYVPAGGPGGIERPSPEIFEALGEEGVFALLADLYERLEQSPIRSMFPADMRAASERSAAFFVQLLGGPALFNERYGPPRMRQRHLPFEIGESERGVWLAAFDETLKHAPKALGFPSEHLAGFRAFLLGFSAWMINVEPTENGPESSA